MHGSSSLAPDFCKLLQSSLVCTYDTERVSKCWDCIMKVGLCETQLCMARLYYSVPMNNRHFIRVHFPGNIWAFSHLSTWLDVTVRRTCGIWCEPQQYFERTQDTQWDSHFHVAAISSTRFTAFLPWPASNWILLSGSARVTEFCRVQLWCHCVKDEWNRMLLPVDWLHTVFIGRKGVGIQKVAITLMYLSARYCLDRGLSWFLNYCIALTFHIVCKETVVTMKFMQQCHNSVCLCLCVYIRTYMCMHTSWLGANSKPCMYVCMFVRAVVKG